MLKKYKPYILYVLFGILTTVINVTIYNGLYYKLEFSNILSNSIAWIITILTAYITNKIWVFENNEKTALAILKQFLMFVACRVATGALDTLIMYITVDVLLYTAWVFKFISNAIVIVLNYLFSKFVIFARRKRK